MKHQQLHVVYIITKLELGGAQKVCLSLLNGLIQQKQCAMLITGTQGPLLADAQQHTVFMLNDLTREIGITGMVKEIRCFFRLIRILRTLKKQYPHIIAHTHSTKAGILGRWAAWFAGITTRIHTIHGFAFHRFQPRYIRYIIQLTEWFTSLITTHFICVSSEDVKTGISYLQHFEQKHSIIRAAPDCQQFYIPARRLIHFPTPPQLFIFGTVSCFKKQKNIFDLLRAFAYVHAHNPLTRLEIIGDGALREEIKEHIDAYKLTGAIILHGWQQQVAPIMATWHAFTLTSLWEGLPCAIIEARLLKLPVLSYCTGGIQDVIAHEHNGLLSKQKDWLTMAQAMLKVSQEPHLHEKLSIYKDDLRDFHTNRMITKHIKLYRAQLHKKQL
jgi:glycosyltransferase involved in cell wall biosynthesis